MKLHIPEREGQLNLALRGVKVLEDGTVRLKASDWSFSMDDNFYIDLEPNELQYIINHSSGGKAK